MVCKNQVIDAEVYPNNQELLRLVNGSKNSLIAMYKLLGDESGLNDTQEKVCVVMGFLGSAEQWDSFNAGWTQVLRDHEVPIFHALDFWRWHLDEENGEVVREKPYEGWTDEDDFCFIDSLIKVIENAGLIKTGTGIVIEYFFSLTEDERRWLTTSALYSRTWPQKGKPNDPWFAAFQSTIIAAAQAVPEGEKLYPIFDLRDSPGRKKSPEQSKAMEIYGELLSLPLSVRSRLGESIVFGTKTQHLGLQAADFLANRSRVYIEDGLGDGKLGIRITDFLEKGTGYAQMLNIRGLDVLLKGCPFRTTFWKVDEFATSEPDYLERMRRDSALNVVAYKAARTGEYYSHHIKPENLQKLKRLGVSGELVYIASPDNLNSPARDQKSDKEK